MSHPQFRELAPGVTTVNAAIARQITGGDHLRNAQHSCPRGTPPGLLPRGHTVSSNLVTMRTNKIRVHLLLVGGLTALACGARIGFKNWYAEDAFRTAQGSGAEGARHMQSLWRSFHYADARDQGFSETLLTRIDWNALDISDVQRARLRVKLADIIRYFQKPSFEDYYKLKTGGLRYHFECSGVGYYWLTNKAVGGRPLILDNPTETTKSIWVAVHSGHGRSDPPRLTRVCLDQVAAGISPTNTPWNLLKGKAAKPFTKAWEAINPGFWYSSERRLPIDVRTEQVFFHLSFFGQFEGSENVGSVFISLWWLPEDQNWAPSRMLADQWLNLRTLF